ncbi:MAG: alkaline phosphatase family protein [Acidobacteria bacterium]|nr:alkaline phosphatase family protein [Acidobacteriota bacterium]
MKSRWMVALTLCLSLGVSILCSAEEPKVQHVLLLSVDGLHALDVARYVRLHTNSALAELARHGITYSNARTPANSDSFPGLLALVTGGSPITTGLFYDVSYDRSIFAPTDTNCSGNGGNMMVFDETIDAYAGLVSLNVIDPAQLPRVLDQNGNCVALYPHSALRTNTIFEVVKAAGGHTAWADKHPAYDLVNGPSGKGVDDLYTPEITNAPDGGFDATVSVVCTVENDNKKVQAILNEIQGKLHDGSPGPGVPTLFGMNFQAVSVGQKLAKETADPSCNTSAAEAQQIQGQPGGYLDGSGTPTPVLAYGLRKTDNSIRMMIEALKQKGIYNSTLIVVTAKHGQSPINPVKTNKPGHFADLVQNLLNDPSVKPPLTTDEIAAANAIISAANCTQEGCGFVQDDDIALIWLEDQGQTADVAQFLNNRANELFIEEVMAGDELKLRFRDPRFDSRTPDIIVQPVYGTIYTTSKKKNAEHGGFSYSDTNVGLIVSNHKLHQSVLKTPVSTSQVAPTILEALGLNPSDLHSVRVELTRELPDKDDVQ